MLLGCHEARKEAGHWTRYGSNESQEYKTNHNSVNETALGMLRSLRESNQAVTDSVLAAQERNIKFAQNVFTYGLEVLKSQAESTQTLVQELGQRHRGSNKRSKVWLSSWNKT